MKGRQLSDLEGLTLVDILMDLVMRAIATAL